ncbi:MAG: sigma-70 family RNA polymerase sigma factor, partial [Rhodothermia bacterium]|nr:sigma-70 family RNA polymerase sigma factor [Rhodothermia bacterium]
MTDSEIIDAFRSGDELAFALLYGRYKTGVYAFCLKMLLDREEALDAVQDTFLRVYENRSRLLSTPAFRSWLFTIARNQCLNRLRQAGRHV